MAYPLGLFPDERAFMAETATEKEQHCHYEHSEFQHITSLNSKDKDQFLFMALFSTALYIRDILDTFVHGLSVATTQRNSWAVELGVES